MRIETALDWILASVCLLTIGLALFVFDSPKLAGFMAAIYFGIGAVLTVMQ